jgi:hypothetical protein
MENENEVIDSIIDKETTENEVVEETTEQEDTEALKKKIQTLEAQKEHWRKKAEKVEAPKVQVKSEAGLTAEDVLAFTGEGITHKEDVELAKTWAKNSGRPVSEVLSDDTFKAVLGVKQEQRKTASATQVKGGAKGFGKVSDSELVKKIEKGELLPEDELERGIEAKYEAKRNANKK